jgi:hypothetical protein
LGLEPKRFLSLIFIKGNGEQMDKEVNDLFLIKCKKCQSESIEIIPIGTGGEILIYCNNCDNQKEI